MSDLVELAAALIAAESINPSFGAGASGEAAAAAVVAEWGRRAGLDVELDEVQPGRPNVLVTARGTGGGRTLLLNGHLDTVGVAGMERPFAPETRDGHLHGRGSYDMKGALAAALAAAAEAKRARLAGDVVVACVIDEELESAGTERLVQRVRADAAIVCEPTEERVCVAHKGFLGFEIEAHGRAAHGSRPDLGIDAIAALGPVLVRLSELADRLSLGSRHPLLGTGSVHASLIEGGQEYSSYPERCLLQGERRTVPGESAADVEAELRELVGDIDAAARTTFGREPFEIDAEHEFPRLVAAAAQVERPEGIAFWTDAALLGAAGIPTVLYGPKGGGAHAVEEWVELASLERCAAVYAEVARAVCGGV